MGRRLAAEFFDTFWLVIGGCGSAVLAAAVPDLRGRDARSASRPLTIDDSRP